MSEKAENEKDSKSIHEQSLVIDGLLPTHTRPMGYTDKMKARLSEMLENNEPKSEIIEEMEEIFNRQLFEGETDYWEWWQESGVDVINTTIGEVEGVSSRRAYHSAVEEIAGWTRRFDYFDGLIKITQGEDIIHAWEENKKGVILGFQNSHHLRKDLSLLEEFYNFGARIIQLTYNLRNNVGDGCTERTDAGLSEFGLKVVKKMNKLGILIDLSHSGYQTTLDAIEYSEDPVAFTHTVCRSVYDHDRGKTDEEIKTLAKNDGYMGILLVPDFLSSENPSLDDFFDHLEHAVDILGIDRVGIGTDTGTGAYTRQIRELGRQQMWEQIGRDGVSNSGWREDHFSKEIKELDNYRDFRDFPKITEGLVGRGFSEKDIKKILGQNFLRIFKEVTK